MNITNIKVGLWYTAIDGNLTIYGECVTLGGDRVCLRDVSRNVIVALTPEQVIGEIDKDKIPKKVWWKRIIGSET